MCLERKFLIGLFHIIPKSNETKVACLGQDSRIAALSRNPARTTDQKCSKQDAVKCWPGCRKLQRTPLADVAWHATEVCKDDADARPFERKQVASLLQPRR